MIVQLIEHFSNEGLSTEEAFTKVVTLLNGSYALGLLDEQDKDTIYVAKTNLHCLLAWVKVSMLSLQMH